MRISLPKPSIAFLGLAFVLFAHDAIGQNPNDPQPQTSPQTSPQPAKSAPASAQPARQPTEASPGGEVGHGAGDIGKGTARGAGAAAKGVGKGAGDLVTLHPIDAASNVGKGAVGAGKDIGVGAAKGTGKIVKGTGRGIGKLFHHHHDRQIADPQN